jgi:hypothetical protein
MSASRRVVIAVSTGVALAIGMAIETHTRHRPDSANSARSKAVAIPSPIGKSAPSPMSAPQGPSDESRAFANTIARMKDPTSRRSMIDQAKIRVATSRAPLLRMLQPISPEKLDQVSEVLASAEVDTNIAMLELHAANPTPSRDQVGAVLAAQAAARDANAGALLDDTEYTKYTSYWQSEPFTQTISQITDVMRGQGSTISPDLQQQMLNAYAEAQIAASQELSSTFGNGTASAADRASAADQFVADAMSKILSADDLNAFMKAQNKIDFGN